MIIFNKVLRITLEMVVEQEVSNSTETVGIIGIKLTTQPIRFTIRLSLLNWSGYLGSLLILYLASLLCPNPAPYFFKISMHCLPNLCKCISRTFMRLTTMNNIHEHSLDLTLLSYLHFTNN